MMKIKNFCGVQSEECVSITDYNLLIGQNDIEIHNVVDTAKKLFME